MRCTLCSKEFDNDFVKHHTVNDHSNLIKQIRLAPTIPVSQKVINNPFDFVKPAKRPHLESDNVGLYVTTKSIIESNMDDECGVADEIKVTGSSWEIPIDNVHDDDAILLAPME